MKRKTRLIDNTQWINNIFMDQDYLYFTDSDINNSINNLCYIRKIEFIENLKNKTDWDRKFLAHPSPLFSKFEMISKTDVSIFHYSENYIQNFVAIEGIKYISYIIENKVYTKKFLSEDKLEELQIIKKIDDNLIIKVKEDIYLTDKNLKIIKKIDYNIVDIIKLKGKYIIQNQNEEVIITDLDFNFEKLIDSNKDFKKIYYLNKTNILISYQKKEITKIYNIFSDRNEVFQNSFLKRAILFDENTLITKKNVKTDMINVIY